VISDSVRSMSSIWEKIGVCANAVDPRISRATRRGNIYRDQRSIRRGTIKTHMAEDKLYKAVYMGSGTFSITKPKRKPAKRRQTNLKSPRRGARKS